MDVVVKESRKGEFMMNHVPQADYEAWKQALDKAVIAPSINHSFLPVMDVYARLSWGLDVPATQVIPTVVFSRSRDDTTDACNSVLLRVYTFHIHTIALRLKRERSIYRE